jgi:tetratricopeptide (TPR) repeat protein/tRNA A-37 threonylcarbamoyl transferase component Bud32
MPTGQPEPIVAPPTAEPDSEVTLVEPTPVSAVTQTPETNRPDDSVTLVEPVAAKTPVVVVAQSAATGRSATAPIAEQETLIEPPSGPGKPPAPARTPGKRFDIPQRLGDYELLEELGRGGMGIVYRARQISVNRMVALKVIRPDRLASMTQVTKRKIVERFRNEAEAAARINHDNLVTVYEVGCEADCHYFSMRYVEGCSLSDKTRKSPADNRQAAEWIEPVCRAVDAVHRNGILHRDLKPQNILLETATSRTLLADFGLAKLADDDANMTQTGDAVGTPSYMSPEQFEDASSVGVGTDIYGLGATLYCLLSGRPPFQASSAALTMKQVISTDPVPLRQINPAVDRDLETICMKCLDKSPARRYDSAAALADELKRYLEGRPILARPVSLPERAARWCRRNPLVASLIGATFAAVVFGVVALGVSNVRTEAARQRSEESFQEAMAAVNDLFTRVSEERLLNEPGLQEVRRDLLDRARSYYERFLKRRENDPTLQAELAETKFRMGLIEEALGDPQAALGWFAKARDAQKARVATNPNSLADARALSNTLTAMGRVAALRDKLDDATENFTEAQTLRERLLEKTSKADDKFDLLRLHANSRMNLGLVERKRGNLDQARTLYVEAQDQRRKTLPTKPQDRAMRRDLAKGFYNLANLAIDRDDEAALRENIDEAIKIYEQLLTENPRDLDDQYLLSLCYRLRADLFAALVPRDAQFLPAAIDDYSQASRIVQKLSDLNPSVTKYLRELVNLSVNLGQLIAQQQRPDEALVQFRKALDLLKRLIDQTPDTLDPKDTALRQTIEAAIKQLQTAKS